MKRRDADEAAQWFRISAAAGDPAARAELANLVLQGMGGPDDRFRTCQWFEEAAATGDLVAAFNYGVCLAEGVGVTRNDKLAALWLRKAAEGVVVAQYWYGRILVEGLRPPPIPASVPPSKSRANLRASGGQVSAPGMPGRPMRVATTLASSSGRASVR